MSHPQSYEILVIPQFTDAKEADASGTGRTIRSAVVEATGATGESGYPRYAGEGMVADIDPATHTVEAILVDGSELDYGLTARISERPVRENHGPDNRVPDNHVTEPSVPENHTDG
ncbi:hypothetical protein [Streptomyces sp. ITFR-6]|uniref:hypothetical protein n=1 Tax=Streptomyces sp. ITFR-6 TaxID=3075197 RepID=UPI00288BF59D|nr:hypothetical protein [Streptomyces sp. ITFR-6]WNI27692.1 hypothetical protein RLT59_02070 [Streptomyces sp. ITFR-6]